jgi:hypothetical protein
VARGGRQLSDVEAHGAAGAPLTAETVARAASLEDAEVSCQSVVGAVAGATALGSVAPSLPVAVAIVRNFELRVRRDRIADSVLLCRLCSRSCGCSPAA